MRETTILLYYAVDYATDVEGTLCLLLSLIIH